MTEAEWLISSDPQTMLRWYSAYDNPHPSSVGHSHLPISDRKLRLWACGCVRQVWHLLTDEWSREPVEVAERFADGEASDIDLVAARRRADHVRLGWTKGESDSDVGRASVAAIWANYQSGVQIGHAVTVLTPLTGGAVQADLLRCVVGNPHWPVTLWPSRCPRCDSPDPARHPAMQWEGEVQPCHDDWHNHTRCPWLTPLVVSLAEDAYQARPGLACERCREGRVLRNLGYPGHSVTDPCPDCRGTGRVEDGRLDPVRLAVLADALEEAGCPTDACEDCGGLRTRAEYTLCVACGGFIKPHPLLAHLRSPGPHVRGCHAVDLCLGRS